MMANHVSTFVFDNARKSIITRRCGYSAIDTLCLNYRLPSFISNSNGQSVVAVDRLTVR